MAATTEAVVRAVVLLGVKGAVEASLAAAMVRIWCCRCIRRT